VGLLDGAHLIAVDTETTGFDPARGHELVEVAHVAIEGGAIGATWASLIRPHRPIPADASRIHGITDAMVATAPAPAVAAAALRGSLGDSPLVFHNAPFDLPFLRVLFAGAGLPALVNPVVDTLGLARGLASSPGGHSLGQLAQRFELPPETAHRALGDALTTARLFLVLAVCWERERGIRSLDELAAASQDVVRVTARR
jgi:DNA polymerase III epsilon subunit family exonuclease